jgi:hypothetical protein
MDMTAYTKQNELLLNNLKEYYEKNDHENLKKMLDVLSGQSAISLRIIDWFVTNYSKQQYTVYTLSSGVRFKVYTSYKLQLKAYSKKRFDPFCRWQKIDFPYGSKFVITTIGQLNFFKWILENEILPYIVEHFKDIEDDMNSRNSTVKPKTEKNRKKREELSISAAKSIKKENIEISLTFN